MAWGTCPPPDYGQAEDQGVFCRWGVIDGKASFWKEGIKSNSVETGKITNAREHLRKIN